MSTAFGKSYTERQQNNAICLLRLNRSGMLCVINFNNNKFIIIIYCHYTCKTLSKRKVMIAHLFTVLIDDHPSEIYP